MVASVSDDRVICVSIGREISLLFFVCTPGPPAPTIMAEASNTYIYLMVAPPYPPHALLTKVHGRCRLKSGGGWVLQGTVDILNVRDSVTVRFNEGVQPAEKYECQVIAHVLYDSMVINTL